MITQPPEPRTQNPKPKTQHPKPITHHPAPRTQNPKAFTLIELMLAAAIMVGFLLAYLDAYQRVLRSSQQSQGFSLAWQAVQSKMEEMQAAPFPRVMADYVAGGAPGNTFALANLSNAQGNVLVKESVPADQEVTMTDPPGSTFPGLPGALVYDNRMWLLGGMLVGSETNAVWSSQDGAKWFQETAAAPWSGRAWFSSLVFDNKLWVLGGWASSPLPNTTTNDIWYSADGLNWSQVTPTPPIWSPRGGAAAVVFDNRMWILGGWSDSGGNVNDVWSSIDGRTWIQAISSAAWSARGDHAAIVYNNRMWVLGGAGTNEVWWSTDGVTWIEALPNINRWSSRGWHTSVVYDNRMWVLGGFDATGNLNDVWWSTDGINWNQAQANDPANPARWSPRSFHNSLVYNQRLWIFGGGALISGSPPVFTWATDPIWSSSGYSRALEVKLSASFRLPEGRIIGEDNGAGGWTVLDGILNDGISSGGEDANGNGELDSPVQLRFLLSEKKEATLLEGP